MRDVINYGLSNLVIRSEVEDMSHAVSGAINGGQCTWTADLYYGISNFVEYCDRPFHDDRHQTDLLLLLKRTIPNCELIFVVEDTSGSKYEVGIEIVKQLSECNILVAGNHLLTKNGICRLIGHGIFEAVVPSLFWQSLTGTLSPMSHYPVAAHFPKLTAKLITYHGQLHQLINKSNDAEMFINFGWDRSHLLLCL